MIIHRYILVMLRSKASKAFFEVLWQKIVGSSLERLLSVRGGERFDLWWADAVNPLSIERSISPIYSLRTKKTTNQDRNPEWHIYYWKLNHSYATATMVCAYLWKERATDSSSSSRPLPKLMFFSLLQRTGVVLQVVGSMPGSVRFTSLRMSESLTEDFLLGEVGNATTSLCFRARWNLQRKDPGWFVGEHMHVIFAGEDDLFDVKSLGRRLSGDNDRLGDGPSETAGPLPLLVWMDRGRRTALRSLEAFMVPLQLPAQ